MIACTLRSSWNIIRRIDWHQHLVNHVNDAVACGNVRSRDSGSINRDCIPDTKRERPSVDGRRSSTLRNVRRCNVSGYNVVKQDVGECRFPFVIVKTCEIDACINERLVGWCKDREWPFSLQGFKQFGLHNSRNKRVVIFCALCRSWNIDWCCCRRQDLINHVNDSVAGLDVCGGYCRSVDGYTVTNGKRQWVSIDGLG